MIRVFCLLLAAALTASGGVAPHAGGKLWAAPSQEEVTLRQLLDRTKEAAGGGAWDRVRTAHIRWAALEGGLSGTGVDTNDLVKVRYVDASDFGVRSGAYGFNGRVAWSQDSAGQTNIQEGSDAREGTVNEAYRRSLAYWYPDRWSAQIEYAGRRQEGDAGFYILRVTPQGGRPFELWFDAATYLLARIVEKTATSTLHVLLADYREVEGVKVPFLVRVRIGDRAENVYRAERVEFNRPVADAHFDPPPPPPPDFTLPADATAVTLPFELINNHIYVSGNLNGRGPFRFLVDTGWGNSSITPEVARSLGLGVRGAQQTSGAGEGTVEVGFTKIAEVRFGGVRLRNQAVVVTSAFDAKNRDGITNFGGLLGYELFKRFVVGVDFERKAVTLTLPDRFTYRGRGTAVPFRLSNTIPLVAGEVEGIPGEFIIDTGYPGTIILYQNFVEKNDLAARFSPKFEAIIGWGIGGPVRAGVTRARVFKLGGVAVRDSILNLSTLTKGSLADTYIAGAVGSGLLKRFNLTFDYGRRRMIFEKNAHYARPDAFDRSGMYLNKGTGWFEVVEVIAGGPADMAGIRPGDRIVSVGGKEASGLSLPEARLKLQGPVKTRVKLILKRGESVRRVELVLRDLI